MILYDELCIGRGGGPFDASDVIDVVVCCETEEEEDTFN